MDGLRTEIFRSISEESLTQQLYKKTSFYPVEVKSPTPLTKVNICSCGDRPVTLYCKVDDTLLCKRCKYDYHRRCHVAQIEKVAKGLMDCEELDKTIKELTTLKLVFQKKTENKRLKRLQHRQEKKSMLTLSKRWKMLQSARIALKKEVEQGIDKYENEEEAKEKNLAMKSRWVVRQVSEYLTELSDNIKKGNESGIYIVLHRVGKDLKEFRNILNDMTEDQNHDDIFEGLRSMVSGIYYCENQGNVTLARKLKQDVPDSHSRSKEIKDSYTPSVRSKSSRSFNKHSRLSSASQRFRPTFRPQTIRMATMLSSLRSGRSSRAQTRTSIVLNNPVADRLPRVFSINSSSDQFPQYHVSAMCHLYDEKLLILESRNNKIKLFSKYDIFITELDLGCSVWDLTTVSKNEVLVTCPGEGKLQRVKVNIVKRDCELAKTGYIFTQKECRAINFVANRIYISFSGERPCIKILSKEGIMYRSIDACKGKITLFKNPLYMHVSKLGKLIYVSDFSLQRVARIDQKGNLQGVINVSPGWPLGLIMTRAEKLIVAVSGTNEIKMINRGSSRLHTLIGPRVLESELSAITVKETNEGKPFKQLYIACTGSSVVKVFTMN